MIRSRSQNSFLAVATLGVYLGLILAGATPTVLAQAATAKQFNVKDEVECTENLDRKPAEAATPSDDQLNEKITASVQRLVSKVRAPVAPISAIIVVSDNVSDAVIYRFASIRLRTDTISHCHPADLIGTQNLARAGLA